MPVRFGGAAGTLALLHCCEDLGGEAVAQGVFLSFEDQVMSDARDMLRPDMAESRSVTWVE